MDNSLQDTAPFPNPGMTSDENSSANGPEDAPGVTENDNEAPPELVFRTPFPRPRPAALRNILATILVGIAIVGLVYYFDQPGAVTSQAITVTGTASGPAPRVGSAAPDFQVKTLDGQTRRLSDFRGHPVWLNFWASWCPPCRAENPDIQAVYAANQDKGLVVLAISIGETESDVTGYVSRTGLKYLIGLDLGTDIAATYRIVGIPTHFFIDRNGVVRDWRIGGLSKDTMEEKVGEIMATSSSGGTTNP